MMAYTPMNYNVVALISQDPAYKKITSNDILGRIMNHEMNIQEAKNIKNLYNDISTSKKQDIALKATNNSKKKKVIIESPSEDEEEEDEVEKEYDEEVMALFIKKFNKFISKRRPYKGDRKEKPRLKRVCYNCSKNGRFMPNTHMRRKKTTIRKRILTMATRKTRNSQRIILMDKLMLVKKWNLSDESSESESDDLAMITIKGKASSSKSLFSNLPKHTCLMAKENKKKVKSNSSSSPKYVTSNEDTLSSDNYASSNDDDCLPSEFVKNPNAMIKGLMKQVGSWDELLEQQQELLVQERTISEELKKLLALEKGKV
jgi:hypothetical protein